LSVNSSEIYGKSRTIGPSPIKKDTLEKILEKDAPEKMLQKRHSGKDT
jgi:hypothetical protein